MYKWNPEEYRTSSSNQKRWGIDLLSNLSLEGHEDILDIGCGDGSITALIAERVPNGLVVGIDNSEDMIKLARESFPPDEYPNLSFLIKDAKELDFNEAFDVVFSNASLHWVIDQVKILEGIKRSLKSGGKILIEMGGKGNASEIVSIVDNITKEKRWSKYFTHFSFPYGFYSVEEYTHWLEILGFSIQGIELKPKDMHHKGENELAAWIRSTWLPYSQRIPEAFRDDFVREVVETYMKNHPADSDGLLHVAMMRLEIKAKEGDWISSSELN